MTRKQRHTKRRDAVLARMRKGERLCAQHTQADGLCFWLEPSNTTVGFVTGKRVLALPNVVPSGDGLLEGVSQSWRYEAAK